MQKFNLSTIVVIVVLLAIAGGVYLSLQGQLPQAEEQSQQGEQKVVSVAGRVTSVSAEENSFTLYNAREEVDVVIQLTNTTDFIRLSFPFDINNPPADATFTPTREDVAIGDLRVDDQVFVRSVSPIDPGQRSVVAEEVQILP